MTGRKPARTIKTRLILRRRRVTLLTAIFAVAVLALAVSSAGAVRQRAANSRPVAAAAASPYATTLNYVIRFYPRWFTYNQQSGGDNQLRGPVTMGPEFGVIVAPNDDTVYALASVDLSKGPQILTIPRTSGIYSMLVLDVWGNVLKTSIKSQTPGTYALVEEGWHGTLPAGVTKVVTPYRNTVWIFRADRHTPSGQDETAQARAFRASLRFASVAAYRKDHSSGATQLLPLALLSRRFKAIADEEIATTPTVFLGTLQQAMHSPLTVPLTASDRQLSQAFDQAFRAAKLAAQRGNHGPMSAIIGATQSAHTQIIDRWRSHVGKTRWVFFGNIGHWGTAYLDRAALTEYMQFDNDAKAATYYDAFTDGHGTPLNGALTHHYVLRFPKDQIPQAKRFWSLTTYIPPGITLYPNALNKYIVANYTPGLQKNRDGSLTIYIQHDPPTHVPQANWLPVPSGKFSLVLRVYGPTGNTAIERHYVPPQILP